MVARRELVEQTFSLCCLLLWGKAEKKRAYNIPPLCDYMNNGQVLQELPTQLLDLIFLNICTDGEMRNVQFSKWCCWIHATGPQQSHSSRVSVPASGKPPPLLAVCLVKAMSLLHLFNDFCGLNIITAKNRCPHPLNSTAFELLMGSSRSENCQLLGSDPERVSGNHLHSTQQPLWVMGNDLPARFCILPASASLWIKINWFKFLIHAEILSWAVPLQSQLRVFVSSNVCVGSFYLFIF